MGCPPQSSNPGLQGVHPSSVGRSMSSTLGRLDITVGDAAVRSMLLRLEIMSRNKSYDGTSSSKTRSSSGSSRSDGAHPEGDSGDALLEALAKLDRLTIRADELTTDGATKSAINAWGAVGMPAVHLLGRADAAVIDAMRIIASLMGSLEMQDDAIRVLENASERPVDVGCHRSVRGIAIAAELRSIRRSLRTTVLDDSVPRPDRDGSSIPRIF